MKRNLSLSIVVEDLPDHLCYRYNPKAKNMHVQCPLMIWDDDGQYCPIFGTLKYNHTEPDINCIGSPIECIETKQEKAVSIHPREW